MTEKFVAFIKVFRGTGRPDRPVVRGGENAADVEDVDPMAWHDGALLVGVFDTKAEAEAEVNKAWAEEVVTDSDGYTQWA